MAARQSLTDRLNDAEEQHQKSPKDEGMDRAGHGVAENFRLADGNAKDAPHALIRMVEAVRPFAETEEISQPLSIDGNAPKRGEENDGEDDGFYHSSICGLHRTKFGRGWSHSRLV